MGQILVSPRYLNYIPIATYSTVVLINNVALYLRLLLLLSARYRENLLVSHVYIFVYKRIVWQPSLTER